MKKIINGRKYDTETAEMIESFWNGYPMNDFKWFSEELYRKKTGEFFLHGEGGPLSKYRERDGNLWGSGEGIIPLDEDKARDWAERHMDADDYEEIFGSVEE